MIISIDFDGTISTGPYPQIGGLQTLAVKTINALAARGHYVIINTCRAGDLLTDAINFMLHEGIQFNRVNDNHPAEVARYNSNSRKIYAHVYIDDKNLGGFIGWPCTLAEIIKLENQWLEKQAV